MPSPVLRLPLRLLHARPVNNRRLSSTRVTDDDYAWLTAEVASIGGGNLPIISVLEGGYNVEQLTKSVRVHLKTLTTA